MAFRRSFRRSSSRRFTRRGVRTITETRRWEAANFFFEDVYNATALSFDLIAWDLMSVGHFSGFGTDPRQLSDAIRSCDIGGVVWDSMIINPIAGTANTQWTLTEVLATDRTLPNDLPASLSSLDWTLTASPVSGSGTGAVDADFPVRIHRRRSTSGVSSTSPPSASNGLIAALSAYYQPPWRTQTVRIKGGLGDRQGLFLFHQLSNFSDTSTCSIQMRIAGTLYYRVRY